MAGGETARLTRYHPSGGPSAPGRRFFRRTWGPSPLRSDPTFSPPQPPHVLFSCYVWVPEAKNKVVGKPSQRAARSFVCKHQSMKSNEHEKHREAKHQSTNHHTSLPTSDGRQILVPPFHNDGAPAHIDVLYSRIQGASIRLEPYDYPTHATTMSKRHAQTEQEAAIARSSRRPTDSARPCATRHELHVRTKNVKRDTTVDAHPPRYDARTSCTWI